jgi:hypothetical protein
LNNNHIIRTQANIVIEDGILTKFRMFDYHWNMKINTTLSEAEIEYLTKLERVAVITNGKIVSINFGFYKVDTAKYDDNGGYQNVK